MGLFETVGTFGVLDRRGVLLAVEFYSLFADLKEIESYKLNFHPKKGVYRVKVKFQRPRSHLPSTTSPIPRAAE